jgi:hypothetical protein
MSGIERNLCAGVSVERVGFFFHGGCRGYEIAPCHPGETKFPLKSTKWTLLFADNFIWGGPRGDLLRRFKLSQICNYSEFLPENNINSIDFFSPI